MHDNNSRIDSGFHPHCCPCSGTETDGAGVTRRGFLGGLGAAALGCAALSGLSWQVLSAADGEEAAPPPRRPLKVKPILVYSTPTRRPQSSWRSWGGIHTQEASAVHHQ